MKIKACPICDITPSFFKMIDKQTALLCERCGGDTFISFDKDEVVSKWNNYVDQWTKCSKKLPENTDVVIVARRNGSRHLVYWGKKINEWEGEGEPITDVVCWMPIRNIKQ